MGSISGVAVDRLKRIDQELEYLIENTDQNVSSVYKDCISLCARCIDQIDQIDMDSVDFLLVIDNLAPILNDIDQLYAIIRFRRVAVTIMVSDSIKRRLQDILFNLSNMF
jgi:hypothetical protein